MSDKITPAHIPAAMSEVRAGILEAFENIDAADGAAAIHDAVAELAGRLFGVRLSGMRIKALTQVALTP